MTKIGRRYDWTTLDGTTDWDTEPPPTWAP